MAIPGGTWARVLFIAVGQCPVLVPLPEATLGLILDVFLSSLDRPFFRASHLAFLIRRTQWHLDHGSRRDSVELIHPGPDLKMLDENLPSMSPFLSITP